MLDCIIFEEAVISNTNKSIQIHEKYARQFFEYFLELISTISFFESNSFAQKAYLSIVKNRFDNLLGEYFQSTGLSVIQSEYERTLVPNVLLELRQSENLKQLRNYLKLKLRLILKIDSNSLIIDMSQKSIAYLDEVIEDLDQ